MHPALGRRTLIWLLALLCPLAFQNGTARADGTPKTLELVFGVYKTDKATEMYRQFSPVIDALSEGLGRELKVEVDIQLRIFRSYQEGLDALVEGDVDFVRFGPASYVMAKERNEDVVMLAMEEKAGRTRFHGLIVARKDSGIKTLADLAGKRFAFGDENSTIGRYLSQAQLIEAGIHASDLKQSAYLERHDKVVRAVQMGDFDAGAVKQSTFDKLNEDGSLVVIQRFENVTKPWIGSSKLTKPVQVALARALTSLEDTEVLKAFKVSRFIAGNDTEYDFVRAGMKRAREFDRRD